VGLAVYPQILVYVPPRAGRQEIWSCVPWDSEPRITVLARPSINILEWTVYPLSLLGNGSINTFPQQRRIVAGVVFYAIHVVSKGSR
jgi:hypothetical protein